MHGKARQDQYSQTLFITGKLLRLNTKCCIRDCITLNITDAYEQRSHGIILKIHVHKLKVPVITLFWRTWLQNLIVLHFSSKPQHHWAEGGKELDETIVAHDYKRRWSELQS
jgi:hypothetical protein